MAAGRGLPRRSSPSAASCSSSTSTASPTASAAATRRRRRPGPSAACTTARSAVRRRSRARRVTGSAARTAPAPRPTTRSSPATASASASGDARNPPALVALGVVQALAREMSRDLQRQRDELVREARAPAPRAKRGSIAKGVDFGVLRVDGQGRARRLRACAASIPTWSSSRSAGRARSPTSPTSPPTRCRCTSASRATALLAERRARGASAAATIRADPRRRRHARRARPRPVHGADRASGAARAADRRAADPGPRHRAGRDRRCSPPTTTSFADDFQRGRQQFHAARLRGLPRADAGPGEPDARRRRAAADRPVARDAAAGAAPTTRRSAAIRCGCSAISSATTWGRRTPPNTCSAACRSREYLTPRLWGVADSAPYLHDGRAPSFDYAIAGHDGEGAAARAAFAALAPQEKGALRVYLMSLRRAPRVIVP